jgi:hypothetical protein
VIWVSLALAMLRLSEALNRDKHEVSVHIFSER